MPSLPSLQASLGELLLKKSEIEAARKAAQETERASAKKALDIAKEAELNKTFGGEPNFELVGEPQTKDFDLIGDPYGGQPAVIPSKTRIPEVLPPESNLPAVIPGVDDPISISPNALDSSKMGIPTAYKAGAGMLAGGLGAYALTNDEPSSQKITPPLATPPIVPESSIKPSPEASETETAFKQLSAAINRNNTPTPIKTLDVEGGFNLGTDQQLRDAQENQKRLNTIAGVGSIGKNFFENATGMELKSSAADDLRKKGELEVKNLKDRVENQKNDPDSTISKTYRAAFERLGIKFKGNPSAADLDKQLPIASTLFNAEETRKARKDELALRAAIMSSEKADKREARTSEENNKYIERQANKLATHAKGFSQIRQAKAAVDAAMQDPNGIKDVTALYSIVKALDPESVVREGEISLANRAKGLYGNIATSLSQATTNPRLLTPKLMKDIQSQISELAEISGNEYNLRRQTALKLGKSRGIPEERFSEIDPYYDYFKEKEKKSPESDTVTIMDSSGKRHTLPRKSLDAAKKRDPGLKVVQ